MRKLYPSFTGLMFALASGRIEASDLDNGLFVFGCTRGHVFEPGAAGERVENIVSSNPEVHAQIISALTTAEAEGRVRWRTRETYTDFDLVNDLLTGNGEQPLLSHLEANGFDDPMPHYSYPQVAKRCQGLEVVF